jgi:hypothetical protein
VPSLGKWSWSSIPMALHISPHDLYFNFHGFQGLIFHQRFHYHTLQWFSSQR